jgi:putative ABC transport system permease protein
MANIGLRLEPLARSAQGSTDRKTTWFVVGLAAFVLLIACANLANLQFARAAARAREYAIRAALGASRFRLMRDLLAESVLLGLVGGALGVLIAAWCNDLLGRRIIVAQTAGIELPLDWRVLGFALLVSIGTGFAFGLLPAWLASRADVNDALKSGGRGATASRTQTRVRHALIVGEVALALVLLSGAAFFTRGLQRFGQRELGWQPDGLLVGYVALNGVKYSDDAKRLAFADALQARLAAIPGVRSATIAGALPTWGFDGSSNYMVEGHPVPAPGQATLATVVNVDTNYFATLGIKLVAGRTFDATDRADAPIRLVINESMARALWPNESPIGKRLGSASRPTEPNWREIIGVVADAGLPTNLNAPDTRFQTYRATAQQPLGYLNAVVRADVPPETLARDLRRAVAALDPDQPIHDIAPVRHEIRQILTNVTLVGWILAAFSVLGVVLAALGIYGVISGSVVQRTNEIGIRVALGAQVRDILALVIGQGLRLALLGTALGLAGAFAIARLLRGIMPQLPAADAVTTIGVTTFLIAVATFACWLPARRATKVDPITALRAE